MIKLFFFPTRTWKILGLVEEDSIVKQFFNDGLIYIIILTYYVGQILKSAFLSINVSMLYYNFMEWSCTAAVA